MSRSSLSQAEVTARLAQLPGWTLRDGKLHLELRFASFTEAFGFMTAVALHAQRRDHHPEFWNVYDRVTLDLWTHDVGGISEQDFELAAKASELASGFRRA